MKAGGSVGMRPSWLFWLWESEVLLEHSFGSKQDNKCHSIAPMLVPEDEVC